MPAVLEAPTNIVSTPVSPSHDVRSTWSHWFAWLCGTTPVRDPREQPYLKDSAMDTLAREHPFLYSKALAG